MVDFDEEQLKKMYIKFHAEEEQNGMITREKFDKVCTCRVPAVAILLQRHTTAGHGGSWPFDTASSHHMDPSARRTLNLDAATPMCGTRPITWLLPVAWFRDCWIVNKQLFDSFDIEKKVGRF
jgi:hypothetical protein